MMNYGIFIWIIYVSLIALIKLTSNEPSSEQFLFCDLHFWHAQLKAIFLWSSETNLLKANKNTSVGRSQLGTLTSLGIQALINSYTTTLSYSTLKKVYDLLNNCYRHAVATRNIGYNPVDGVQLPKQENMSIQTKEIAILPDVDVELLEAAQSMCYKTGRLRYWYAPAYALILNTGLRSGEALALTWDNVNFHTKTLTIR